MIEYMLYVIIAVCLIIFFFFIYDSWRLRRLRKKYNPDDNTSRKGDEFTRQREFRSITETEPNSAGLGLSTGRGLLQTTKLISDGEDSSIPRKTNAVSNFISKLRRTSTNN